ncbi:unnamed protein product [Durusdinium trenchii]|uniref:EF-hand domain-containing protein n=1 Tax=Durusdinium trenchii TaxID=1381693 RepID=A0ABP0RHK6_9DINO
MELPSVQQYLKFLEATYFGNMGMCLEFLEAMPKGFPSACVEQVTVRDCRPLFEILAEGDGRITIAEFCKGLMQIKGQARALDIVVLQHENSKMMEQNHEILTILRAFSRKSRTARGSSAECSQRLHGSESSSRLSLPTSENAALDAKFAEQEKVIRELLSGNGVMSEKWKPDPPLKACVKGNLDMLIAGVVVINVIMMIIHSQWVAWKSEVELNLIEPSDSMFSTQAFDVIEYIFFSIYCSDMLVRMIVLRKEWYFDPKAIQLYVMSDADYDETLSTAANDAELVIEDSRRTAVQYQKKLEELFRLVDDDGDGNLTPEEFVEAMSLPSVDLYLRYLEITIRDCGPLFDILSGEDGLITISEFCQGIMQLKGNARALDMVVLQHENAKLMKAWKER